MLEQSQVKRGEKARKVEVGVARDNLRLARESARNLRSHFAGLVLRALKSKFDDGIPQITPEELGTTREELLEIQKNGGQA